MKKFKWLSQPCKAKIKSAKLNKGLRPLIQPEKKKKELVEGDAG